ncbi:MAG: 50S ribosomal protein L18 [Nitrospirae bacterium]|nr:MAG: 50S ribosomal protein L18 [Nitrospirota bacterium]
MNLLRKSKALARRKRRVRLRVRGTPARPRLTVYRSNAHIYAQIVDDTVGRTLVSASSIDPTLRGQLQSGGNVEAARQVGTLLAERAKAIKIHRVVFDRGGRKYHGRIQALADASRAGGLEF